MYWYHNKIFNIQNYWSLILFYVCLNTYITHIVRRIWKCVCVCVCCNNRGRNSKLANSVYHIYVRGFFWLAAGCDCLFVMINDFSRTTVDGRAHTRFHNWSSRTFFTWPSRQTWLKYLHGWWQLISGVSIRPARHKL